MSWFGIIKIIDQHICVANYLFHISFLNSPASKFLPVKISVKEEISSDLSPAIKISSNDFFCFSFGDEILKSKYLANPFKIFSVSGFLYFIIISGIIQLFYKVTS